MCAPVNTMCSYGHYSLPHSCTVLWYEVRPAFSWLHRHIPYPCYRGDDNQPPFPFSKMSKRHRIDVGDSYGKRNRYERFGNVDVSVTKGQQIWKCHTYGLNEWWRSRWENFLWPRLQSYSKSDSQTQESGAHSSDHSMVLASRVSGCLFGHPYPWKAPLRTPKTICEEFLKVSISSI